MVVALVDVCVGVAGGGDEVVFDVLSIYVDACCVMCCCCVVMFSVLLLLLSVFAMFTRMML